MTYDSARSGSVAIGAMEMKRCYQRNMLIAGVSVIAAVAGVIALLLIFADGVQAKAPTTTRIDTLVAWVLPPPRPIEVLDPTPPAAPAAIPDLALGVLEAVADSLLGDLPEATLPTPDQLSKYIDARGGDTGAVGGAVVLPNLGDFIDPRDSAYVFVATDEMPVMVSQPTLEYPSIARRAGIEGSVGLRVRVDTQGNVTDAFIERDSGASAGFEEAALQAARQTKWRPALQNGTPVAVWVSYGLKFQLREASR